MYIDRALFVTLIAALLVGCSTRTKEGYIHRGKVSSRQMSKKSYAHPTMRPYTVRGKRYYPSVVRVGEVFHGVASWYGPNFHGKLTSNGERYDMHAMTAAHKTLPMNTILKVTNKRNGRSVLVRVNDRGPFVDDRIIDLSNAAAKKLDMIRSGTASVRLEVVGFAGKGKKSIPSIKKLQKESPKEKVLGSYIVQIASFSRFQGALKTREKYDGLDGYRAVIKDVEQNGRRVFRVQLRGFRSEQEIVDFVKKHRFNNAIIFRE